MNRHYPLWNVTAQQLQMAKTGIQSRAVPRDIETQLDYIINYHLQRAAINSDWDVFRIIVEHHRRYHTQGAPRLISDAMYIAHLNGNRDLAMYLYRQYGKKVYSIDTKGHAGIISYYMIEDNPGKVNELISMQRIHAQWQDIISPTLADNIKRDPSLIGRFQKREDYIVISGIFPTDEQLRRITYDPLIRLMLRYKSQHPSIPYDLLIFIFRYDVINKIEDPTRKAIIEGQWMRFMANYIHTIPFFNLYMIRELDKLLADANFQADLFPYMRKPILMKGSNMLWNKFMEMDRHQKIPILGIFAIKIVYLQRMNRPVTPESIISNQL